MQSFWRPVKFCHPLNGHTNLQNKFDLLFTPKVVGPEIFNLIQIAFNSTKQKKNTHGTPLTYKHELYTKSVNVYINE